MLLITEIGALQSGSDHIALRVAQLNACTIWCERFFDTDKVRVISDVEPAGPCGPVMTSLFTQMKLTDVHP